MPTLIYCDHNFLISLFDEQKPYTDRLQALVSDGTIRFVLSTWHWVEMAKDKDDRRALALADFADSLNPLWLRERVSLHRDHMRAAFCAWSGIAYSMPAAVVSLREMVADLQNLQVATVPDISSRAFVSGWQKNPNLLEGIVKAHQSNMQSFGWLKTRLRLLIKQRDRARKAALQGFLPETTPAGLVIDQQTKDRFLQQCDLSQCGTLTVEIVVSEEDRHFLGRLSLQHFIDRQHLVLALPHVDFFATNDKRLTKLVCRVRRKLQQLNVRNIAEAIDKQQFDARYIQVGTDR